MVLSDDLVARFAAWFVNRWDQYAVQLRDGSYWLVPAPLSLDVVAAHLAGRCTLGAYLLDADSRCRFAVFDDDTPEGLVRLAGLAGRLEELGIASMLEASRAGRAHLWVHFAEPVAGAAARAWLLPFAEELGIEFYPKQDRLAPGGSGSLIRLPLGVHRRARAWYPFVQVTELGDLVPVGETVEQCCAWVCEAVQPVAVPVVARVPAQVAVGEVGGMVLPGLAASVVPVAGEMESIGAWCRSQDIVEVVGRFVALDARGMGSCPFKAHHVRGDMRPSFQVFGGVDPHWYCYTWGRAGDLFDFVCLYFGLSKREAWAALRAGQLPGLV